jgi:predicted metal-dependent peptidase
MSLTPIASVFDSLDVAESSEVFVAVDTSYSMPYQMFDGIIESLIEGAEKRSLRVYFMTFTAKVDTIVRADSITGYNRLRDVRPVLDGGTYLEQVFEATRMLRSSNESPLFILTDGYISYDQFITTADVKKVFVIATDRTSSPLEDFGPVFLSSSDE